jgi:formylglycine-generating enzyme required for sulfatase activity
LQGCRSRGTQGDAALEPRTAEFVTRDIPDGTFVGSRTRCTESGGLDPARAAKAWLEDGETMYLPAFRIDRKPMTCGQWAACVEARGCVPANDAEKICGYLGEPAMQVTLGSAAQFCKWRGGTLPSYPQWQRAIRGTRGQQYPMGWIWDDNGKCIEPTVGDNRYPRCEHTSRDDVVTGVLNRTYEWTRDVHCVGPIGIERTPYPVAVDLREATLDRLARRIEPNQLGEFRCVYDTQP